MRVAVAPVALTVVLGAAACGASHVSAGSGTGSVGGRPTPTARADAPSSAAKAPPPPATVDVTAGISGATARLQVGQTLVVHSPNNKPGKAGAMVAEPGSRVLRGLGGNAATGWQFLATAPGTVHVVVTYGPSCAAGEVCPQFRALLGRVTVVVR